jgi:branched-chain amino acid transport system permease protein
LRPANLAPTRAEIVAGAFWPAWLAAAVALPFLFTSSYFASLGVLFGTYVAINLMWTLVLSTAGIFSFATLAFFGAGAYAAAKVGGGYVDIAASAEQGSLWLMLVAAVAAGAVLGLVVGAPTIRLRGVYFALFTFGLVELFRAIVLQEPWLGTATGLNGNAQFTAADISTDKGRLANYFVSMGLVAFALVVFWAVDRGRLGLLLRTARESEPVAFAMGIGVVRARLAVFVISSATLGVVGWGYAGIYGSVSPTVFSFEALLVLFSMLIIGGLGSARGVVIGVAVVIGVQETFVGWGPMRFVLVGCILLIVTLFTENGIAGLPYQLARWRRTQRLRSSAGRINGGSHPAQSTTP